MYTIYQRKILMFLIDKMLKYGVFLAIFSGDSKSNTPRIQCSITSSHETIRQWQVIVTGKHFSCLGWMLVGEISAITTYIWMIFNRYIDFFWPRNDGPLRFRQNQRLFLNSINLKQTVSDLVDLWLKSYMIS